MRAGYWGWIFSVERTLVEAKWGSIAVTASPETNRVMKYQESSFATHSFTSERTSFDMDQSREIRHQTPQTRHPLEQQGIHKHLSASPHLLTASMPRINASSCHPITAHHSARNPHREGSNPAPPQGPTSAGSPAPCVSASRSGKTSSIPQSGCLRNRRFSSGASWPRRRWPRRGIGGGDGRPARSLGWLWRGARSRFGGIGRLGDQSRGLAGGVDVGQ